MRLARRLRQLLKRKGYRVTSAVREGLTDLVATVFEENPDVVESEAAAEDGDDAASTADLAKPHPITCPHCGETIEIILDLSGDDQDGIQDCSVCCSPIHVTYTVRNGGLGSFSADAS